MMLTNKLLVVDCDGVLLDWHEGFTKWFKDTHNYRVNPDHPHDSWDFYDWFLPQDGTGAVLTPEGMLDAIKEFNGYPRALKPIKDAVDYISELCALYSSILDIKVLTSFGSCPIQSKFREDYLNIVFNGAFSEVIVLPLGCCKEAKLKELKPDWFVEDNKEHAEKAAALGIKTFLLDTTYNQGEGDFIRVYGWFAIDDDISYDLEGVK